MTKHNELYEIEQSDAHMKDILDEPRKHYPCDYGECPYDAEYSDDCHRHCGLGVDENIVDDE